MKLHKLRIKDFRAIVDTGWIDCQQITTFVGANESGKTTIFMALLKLVDKEQSTRSSIKGLSYKFSKIDAFKDVPIDRFEELKEGLEERVFVEAGFLVDQALVDELKFYVPNIKKGSLVYVSRNYGGNYKVWFDESTTVNVYEEHLKKIAPIVVDALPVFIYFQEMTEVKSQIDLVSLAYKLKNVNKNPLTAYEAMYYNLLNYIDVWESNLIKSIETKFGVLEDVDSKKVDFREVLQIIPLFEKRLADGMKKLNEEFKKWWGNDEITLKFGTHKRGVTIEVIEDGETYLLENRSTGFRRFFGLFLSFSVSVHGDFENSILLFDEAGAALHSLTQKKLVNFFNELGKYTQIMYNTHSSYMLPVSEMNRVRVVYKDKTDHTFIANNLKITDDKLNEESIFAVQSSLAMHLAESTLAGCVPVMVLNEADRTYLQIIKNVLVATGHLSTIYETLVFSTGPNGIDAAAETFSGDEDLPVVLLPNNEAAQKVRTRLINGVYKNEKQKVLTLKDFEGAGEEFEDIIPPKYVSIFSSVFLKETLGADFKHNMKKDLLKQVNEYVEAKNIELPSNFRYELAKRMRLNTMRFFKDVKIPKKYLKLWKSIWYHILSI